MNERIEEYHITRRPFCAVSTQPAKIEYTNDAPNVRQWLMDLRRDLLRKVGQIDKLLQTLDT